MRTPNLSDANRHFDAAGQVEPGHLDILILEGRIVGTCARFSQGEAVEAVGLGALESDFTVTSDNRLNFGGTVIISRPHSIAEAGRILDRRGWGERVDGITCGMMEARPPDGFAPHALN